MCLTLQLYTYCSVGAKGVEAPPQDNKPLRPLSWGQSRFLLTHSKWHPPIALFSLIQLMFRYTLQLVYGRAKMRES
jgi:hypothetical protein